MTIDIKKNVQWCGKIDWELRNFHGEELSTPRGSSYNSYLIRDEKNVIIDTVHGAFADEYIEQLQRMIDLNEISYVVVNHAEPDHSGALPKLMEHCKNATIICTNAGMKSIKGYYHKDWKMMPVKTGDIVKIGTRNLVFVEMAMIHWPDSMMTYLTNDNILFSNDAFGQHYANAKMFSSKSDKAVLLDEALQYYANIVAPYSQKVAKKIAEILTLSLPIDYICPSHGVMWDENITEIVELYDKWAKSYLEDKVTIIYDSMYQSTRKMAEAIAEGIADILPDFELNIYNAAKTEKSRIVTEIFASKLVLAGSPTVHNGVLSSVAAVLGEIAGFGLKGKKAASFGSYGWNPVGIKILNEKFEKAGFELINEGAKALWNPDDDVLAEMREYGRNLAENIK